MASQSSSADDAHSGTASCGLQKAGLTRNVQAGRTTVLWIWGASALALFGPALAGGLGGVAVLLAVTLAFAVLTSLTLRATVEIDSDNRLTIRYLIYSFSDELENIRAGATPKFDFRRDDNLGVKRLFRGTRLPCFKVGWFVLRNGKVAFVCVSRKRRARALVTRDGCYILVDPRIARWIQSAATQ